MEIRTLRYFLAAAREENMTRAAELLHVTQPTLSKQLKSLEDELGKKLFTRHSFSIALTDEGVLLRNRAEDLVSMADKIEQEFLSLDDITGGTLYFGLAESCQIRYLAREIHAFKNKCPALHYHITWGACLIHTDVSHNICRVNQPRIDMDHGCLIKNGQCLMGAHNTYIYAIYVIPWKCAVKMQMRGLF